MTRHTAEHQRRRVLTGRELGHIRQMYREGATQAKIAAEIGVSQATISTILRGEPKPDRKSIRNTDKTSRNRIRKTGAIADESGVHTTPRNYQEEATSTGESYCPGCLPDDLDRSPCPGHRDGYNARQETWSALFERLAALKSANGRDMYRSALTAYAATLDSIDDPAREF